MKTKLPFLKIYEGMNMKRAGVKPSCIVKIEIYFLNVSSSGHLVYYSLELWNYFLFAIKQISLINNQCR